MKPIAHKYAQELYNRMVLAAKTSPNVFYAWCDEMGSRKAIVEFPTGELMNERIKGFVWAWGMRGIVQTASIEKADRFNANGLEGKVCIETTANVALMVYGDLPEHRCQVKLPM